MPRASLFGVDLAWSCDGLAADPMARLLEATPIPPAPPQPPGVQMILRPATATAAADPLAEGARPSFYQGVVQAYLVEPPGPARPLTFLLWDRASRVTARLDPHAPLIEAEIAPEDREPAPGSALGMLQIALALTLRCHGLFHLHAAALVHPSGAGVLLAGGSGAGKTTATIALLEAGFDDRSSSSSFTARSYSYLGDDSLFLRARPEGVSVLASPRAFHLGPETLSAFPRLRPLADPRAGARGKLALDPRLAFPERFRPAMEAPAVVLLPQIRASSAASSIAPVAPADALFALIGSSASLFIDGLPGRAENLALLPKLLPRKGAFELALGQDALAAPASTLAPLLEQALSTARRDEAAAAAKS
jgi:hypothetical protein